MEIKKCPGYKMDIGHWIPSNMQEIKTCMTSGDNVIESKAPETKRSREEYYIICTIVEMSVWYAVNKWSIVATKEAIVWLTKHSWNKKEYRAGPWACRTRASLTQPAKWWLVQMSIITSHLNTGKTALGAYAGPLRLCVMNMRDSYSRCAWPWNNEESVFQGTW